MVHPDYQYSPLLVPAMAAMIAYGEYEFVLGSRVLAQDTMARGMPAYKFVANRLLTLVENLMLRQKLSEYHTGLRAYSQLSARGTSLRAELGRLRLRQPDHRPGSCLRGEHR